MPFSKYAIRVMVGIQGRFVAIDFSVSAACGLSWGQFVALSHSLLLSTCKE